MRSEHQKLQSRVNFLIFFRLHRLHEISVKEAFPFKPGLEVFLAFSEYNKAVDRLREALAKEKKIQTKALNLNSTFKEQTK